MKEINNKKQNLYKAITLLKNKKEVECFLRDLCTVSEIDLMSERLSIAMKLRDKLSYRRIAKESGSSTATITRVAHWLHHGLGGYVLVLKKLK
ncbi:transcriptional regulator [Candidatus Parcubacteria bacterium]|nr:MAG: transcriptional regulator [Candidatus Parcubacteria bacterium]